MNEKNSKKVSNPGRWTLLRDVAIFQIKLIVDGMRDFLLVPASLVAGLLSLITGVGDKPGPHFYRLLSYGKDSDHWINLFGALRHSPEGSESAKFDQEERTGGFDEILGQVEHYIVDEYERGGVTTQAKKQIDKAVDIVRRRHAAASDPDPADRS